MRYIAGLRLFGAILAAAFLVEAYLVVEARGKVYTDDDGLADESSRISVSTIELIRKNLRTGYVLIDIKSGVVLSADRAREVFIPASTAKIPSVIAITRLADVTKRPVTRVIATGPINRGIIRGDVVLVGSADPMFDTPAAETIVAELKKKGLTGINGRFLFYDRTLPHQASINEKQPPDAPYNPGLSGLGINSNRYRVTWKNGNLEGTEFPLSPLPLSSALLTTAQETDKKSTWLPVNDPGPFAASIFRSLAKKQGINLPPPERTSSVPEGVDLATYAGDSLYTAISRAFYYSNNIAFEMMALSVTGEETLELAAHTLLSSVKDILPQVSWTGIVLPNASGLSSEARMSPGQCAAMIRYMATTKVNGKLLSKLLPGLQMVPFGKPDEVPDSVSPVHGKSGTINYGRALAGTIRTDSGKELAWCIMSDDQEKRAMYDALSVTEQRAEPERSNAKAWLAAAKRTEAEILLDWKSRY